MDFPAICRTCMCREDLNPIFINPDNNKRYSSALYTVAGVKVEINDGLPQNMCTKCINTLNDSLTFRKQCKDVETELLNIKKEQQYLDNKPTIQCDKFLLESKGTEYNLKVKIKQEECTEHINNDNLLLSFVQTSYNIDAIKAEYMPEDSSNNVADVQDILEPISVKTGRVSQKWKCTVKTQKTEIEPPYEEKYSTDSKVPRVTCKICNKDLSKRSIDTHMTRMHPGADERKVKCDLCDQYVFAEKMKRHLNMVHRDGKEKGFRCVYCKTEFGSREELADHVTTCTSKKKRRVQCKTKKEMCECDVCHKTMQRASLRMHKAIKHAGLGPVCEHCGKKFGNKNRLQEHCRARHGYDKFSCSYCSFRSASLAAMRNHERRHRGEKPFVCDACDKKFHAAYLLAQHKQSHRTEKTVKCPRCPARFKARNGLHAHRRARHAPPAASPRRDPSLLEIILDTSYTWVLFHVKHYP